MSDDYAADDYEFVCDTAACYDNEVSGSNLVTSLVIDLLIGVLCYFGFVLWRDKFAVYHGRDFLPGVKRRPPPMKLGGHWQLWWVHGANGTACAPTPAAAAAAHSLTPSHPAPPLAGRGSSPPGG